jgi:hypothetical protein
MSDIRYQITDLQRSCDKGTVFPVLNEDILRSGGLAPPLLTSALLVDGGEFSASLLGIFIPGKESPVPMDRRLGGSQNQSGHYGEETTLDPAGN